MKNFIDTLNKYGFRTNLVESTEKPIETVDELKKEMDLFVKEYNLSLEEEQS